MFQASQDAGDNTSITSGLDGEAKKMKNKRSSIKRKVQSFSHESDDAVIEPLLQKDKEKTDVANQSAKYLLTKTKTDSISDEKGNDKDKLLADSKFEKPSISCVPGITDKPSLSNVINDNIIVKSYVSTVAPIHNHMNTNVFGSPDAIKGIVAPKTQILVEIDGNRSSGYNPSPLIFTTAKIHTNGNIKQMEPVQMTPLPILSTIEGSVLKTGSTSEHDKNVRGLSKNSILSTKLAKAEEEVAHTASNFSHCSTIPNKDITSVASAGEIKVQNVSNKTTAASYTLASYSSQPLDTAPKTKTSGTVSCGDNTQIKVISPTLNSNANVRLKDEPSISTKSSLSDSKYVPISETAQTSMNHKDTTLSGKTPIVTKAEDIAIKPNKTTPQTNIAANSKISTTVSKDNKIDVNKNFETECGVPSQKPGSSKDIKSPVGINADSSKSDAVSRKLSNKLQRQKSSQIDDIMDSGPKPRVEQFETKQSPNAIKEINNVGIVKEIITIKQVGSEAAETSGKNRLKTFSPDTTISDTSNLITKITASITIQPNTCKPSVITSTAANSSVFNVTLSSIPIKSSIPVVTSTINKMHSPKVSTFKSPVTVTTTASYSKPTTTAQSVTTNTTTNVNITTKTQISTNAKPGHNTPTTTAARTTTGSSTKPKTVSSTSQAAVSAKTTVASSSKSSPTTTSNISFSKTTTNTMPQSTSKAPTKQSTTKVMNTQTIGTKPTSSIKAVLPPVVPPTTTAKESVKNKHGDSKTSECNKDKKSFK